MANGLLDFLNSPGGMGLLSAVGAGMAGARRGQPINAIGAGLLGGVQGYTQAQDQQTQQAFNQQRQKLLDSQVAENELQAKARQQAMELASQRQGYLGSVGRVTSPVIGAAPNQFDPMKWMSMGGSAEDARVLADPNAFKPKPMQIKEGESLIDPVTMKTIYQSPKQATPSDIGKLISEMNALPPGSPLLPTYRAAINKATTHAPATSVSVNTRQETEYAKDQGKQFSELMASINKQGFAAPSQLRKLERMEQLLTGVDGGKLAPTGVEVASALNAMGIKIDPRLGNKEAAIALGRELAGSMRQPGTGPMTDKDFDNFLAQVPDLSKTAHGRQQIMATMRAALHRDMKISKMAREYVKKNGTLDNGFMDEAAQYIAENPVVSAPSGWTVEPAGKR